MGLLLRAFLKPGAVAKSDESFLGIEMHLTNCTIFLYRGNLKNLSICLCVHTGKYVSLLLVCVFFCTVPSDFMIRQ